MEQPHFEQEPHPSVSFRLLRGAVESVLNVGRRIDNALDAAFYHDYQPEPGLLAVVRQIREERKTQH